MKKQTKNGVIKPKYEEKITDLTLAMSTWLEEP